MTSTAPVAGMWRRRVRVLAPAAAIATALLVTSCAAGQQAQTAAEKPTLDGTSADIGNIKLRGLTIDAPTSANWAKGTDAQVRLVIVNTGTRADTLTSISGSAITGWSSYDTPDGAAQAQSATSSPTTATLAPLTPSTASTSSSAHRRHRSVSNSPTNGASSSSVAASPSPITPSAVAPVVPQGSRSVTVPAGGRVSYGTPDATKSLLLMKFTQSVYPGTVIRLTFTFANAGSKTVAVPVALSGDPNDSVVPGPSASGQEG